MDYLEYGVLDSYETVKRMLTVDLINRDQNKEFLKGIPRHDMEDLSLIYRIRINGDDNELMADILFTNKMLERYGITPEQLHHDALETAGRKEPLCILTVKEIMERMSDMLGMPALLEIPEQEAEYGFSLYMATNLSGRKGASVIAYYLMGLIATNLGEAWRLAAGETTGEKILGLMASVPAAFGNPLPSLHPFDLLIGLLSGAALWLAVYLKGKNAKKFRTNMEYGSARWGTAKDIEPFMAPKFEDNIILTKTERLMMSNRPKNPANARNKNVLIVGGSGSGKTRFWLKPNLLQMHSSYVVTDPKG